MSQEDQEIGTVTITIGIGVVVRFENRTDEV